MCEAKVKYFSKLLDEAKPDIKKYWKLMNDVRKIQNKSANMIEKVRV